MLQINYSWNGDHAKQLVFNAAWDGLLRAAVYYWQSVQNALNIPNTGTTIRGRGPAGQKKSFTVYSNPSKPGEAPHKITGWLQRHIQYWTDKGNLIVRVGLALGAKYGLYLELGVKGGKEIRPKKGKALVFWSSRENRLIFRRKVKQGAIKPRPFILSTLKSVMPQLQMLVRA
jgi:hypothetical protein